MTDFNTAKGRLSSLRGIICVICMIVVIVGIIIILVAENDKGFKYAKYQTIIYFVVVVLNVCMIATGKHQLGAIAAIMFLSVIDYLALRAGDKGPQGQPAMLVIGHLLCAIGDSVSFIAIPFGGAPAKPELWSILRIVAGAGLCVGTVFLWIEKRWWFQLLFLGILYILCTIWRLDYMTRICGFGAGILLYWYWIILPGSGGTYLFGLIIVVASLALMVIIQLLVDWSGKDSKPPPLGDAVKSRFAGVLNILISIILFVSLILSVVACIIIWIGNHSRDRSWTALFVVVFVFTGCLIWFLRFRFLIPVFLAFAFSVIPADFGKENIGIGLVFFDMLVTSVDQACKNDGGSCPGWLMQNIASFGALFCLTDEVQFGRPKGNNGLIIFAVINGVCIILGNFFLWIRSWAVVSPFLLGVLHLCGALFGMEAATEFCFFIPAYLLRHWLVFFLFRVGSGGYGALMVIGCLLILGALIGMLIFAVLYFTSTVDAPTGHPSGTGNRELQEKWIKK